MSIQKKKIKFSNGLKDYIIAVVCIIISILLGVISYRVVLYKKSENIMLNEEEFSNVTAICELATLKSFYHNVAEFEKPADPIWGHGWGKVGFKKFWMEYSGIVDVGIDVNDVKISIPDENGIVEVYIPDARVLNVTADKSSISTPLEETGAFTSITSQDQAKAFSEAQIEMKDEAEQNTELLLRAKERAKKLLNEYIVNTGKQMGKNYKVSWKENNELGRNEG